jgi:hypothetical protein
MLKRTDAAPRPPSPPSERIDMPDRITPEEALGVEEITDEILRDLVFDSVVPACCERGCEVEPDGQCSHGHPSVLVALGII